MSDFLKRFAAVQTELKAPKNLKNTFGNYNYRNAEGILEAVKPILAKQELALVLNDDIVIDNNVYIMATATVLDINSDEHISARAYAQVDVHKGMSADQCTGCASSYARKYALNGLFLLDDTKDEDSDEFAKEQKAKEKKSKEEPKAEVKEKPKAPTAEELNAPISKEQEKELMDKIGDDVTIIDYLLYCYEVKKLSELSVKGYLQATRHWDLVKGKAHERANQQSSTQS